VYNYILIKLKFGKKIGALMPYTNITHASIRPIENYVVRNWVISDQTNFLKRHIVARGAHFILSPASFITSSVDTIIGLVAGMGAICTLGKHRPTFKMAFEQLAGASQLLARPYVHILKTINPQARFSGDDSDRKVAISGDGEGFISNLIINPLKNVARECYNSDSVLKRHVASRLTYALLAISCLVTRAVDGLIGIPAAGLSILTGGKFEFLNNLAYRALQAPAIINDLFYCTIKFINPWAGVERI
jgi:hypothetical protein